MNSQSVTPKISSHELINKHKQFDLNYSTKHIFSQNYFMNTIHVNSETLGLLFTANHQTSISLCEPEFHNHFRPHTHHNTIYSTIYTINNPNSPWTVTNYPNGFQKLPLLGSKIWDRIKRSFKASSQPKHHKALKSRVKQVG